MRTIRMIVSLALAFFAGTSVVVDPSGAALFAFLLAVLIWPIRKETR